MSIASRITEMEQHIGNAYDGLEDLGVDLTDVDKNIDNIATMLGQVWNEYPKVTATDVEEATLNGTKKGRMEIDLKGQTEQEQLSGANLMKYNERTTSSSGVNYSCDTSGNVVMTGTASTLVGFAYNLSTNMIYLNAGTYKLKVIGKKFNNILFKETSVVSTETAPAIQLDSNNEAVITIENDNTPFKITCAVENQTVNAEFYITLASGSTATTERYCGGIPAPNPSYEIPVKNVTGNANVNIQNKNLLVAQKIVDDSNVSSVYIDDEFIHYVTGPNKLIIKPSMIKENTAYTCKLILKSGVTTTNTIKFYAIYTDGTSAVLGSSSRSNTDEFELIFSTNANKTLDFIRSENTSNKVAYLKIDGSMFLEGSYTSETIPSYVPHAEQNFPFTFEEGQFLADGETLEDDGIHKKYYKVIFDGSENWERQSQSHTNIINLFRALPKKGKDTECFCSIGKYNSTAGVNNDSIANILKISISGINLLLDLDLSIFSGTLAFKNYCLEQYENDTPVTVEYELATPETIPYNSTQASQYEAIKKAKAYNDITHISSTSDELPFIMDIEALKK